MNRRNKTKFAIVILLLWSLLPKDLTNQKMFIFTAAGVVTCGGRKTFPVHHHNSDFIFSGPLESLKLF